MPTEPRKKRAPISEETREKMRQSARNRSPEAEARRIAAMRASKKYQESRRNELTEEGRQRISETSRKNWESGFYDGKVRGHKWNHTEESKQRIREAKRQQWAEGVYDEAAPATRRRTSRTEYALAPILAALGYEHVNDDNPFFVPIPGRRGFVPDFVDRKGKRVFEYFGNFWHHPNDEQFRIEAYRSAGWECEVLWEYDLAQWVEDHRHLATDEQAATLVRFSQMPGVLPTRGNTELPDPKGQSDAD